MHWIIPPAQKMGGAKRRIIESSGSEVFDASVLAAFDRLGVFGEPPPGSAGTKQVTFRTRAD
jgi:outer membrane biosynthesis protein TonB